MRVCANAHVCPLNPSQCWCLTISLPNPPPLFSLSRSWALNEAGGQWQCAANWPSLLGAQASCDWTIQWGPAVQPPLHPALFHSNSQDAHCSPVHLSLVSSTWGHCVFTYIASVLSSLLSSCLIFVPQKILGLWVLSESPVLLDALFLLINIHLLYLIFLNLQMSHCPLYFILLDCHSHT